MEARFVLRLFLGYGFQSLTTKRDPTIQRPEESILSSHTVYIDNCVCESSLSVVLLLPLSEGLLPRHQNPPSNASTLRRRRGSWLAAPFPSSSAGWSRGGYPRRQFKLLVARRPTTAAPLTASPPAATPTATVTPTTARAITGRAATGRAATGWVANASVVDPYRHGGINWFREEHTVRPHLFFPRRVVPLGELVQMPRLGETERELHYVRVAVSAQMHKILSCYRLRHLLPKLVVASEVEQCPAVGHVVHRRAWPLAENPSLGGGGA